MISIKLKSPEMKLSAPEIQEEEKNPHQELKEVLDRHNLSVFNPDLVRLFGLCESVLLQYIHRECTLPKALVDDAGRKWLQNSVHYFCDEVAGYGSETLVLGALHNLIRQSVVNVRIKKGKSPFTPTAFSKPGYSINYANLMHNLYAGSGGREYRYSLVPGEFLIIVQRSSYFEPSHLNYYLSPN